MLRSILFVAIMTLVLGGGVKLLSKLTSGERVKFIRGTMFWIAMALIATIITFLLTVSF